MTDSAASVAVVDETCRTARNAIKTLSKHLVIMSSVYSKLPFEKSGPEVLEALRVITESIDAIQESVGKANKSIELNLNVKLPQGNFPDTVVITTKEYAFLNAVLERYTTQVCSSTAFSLFSSDNNICSDVRQPCPNADRSKNT